MYDFTFGNKKEIIKNTEEFLIFVKRLLPRWVNGIPDSEYLAIYHSLKRIKKKNPIILETGSGASSVAMFLYCAIHGGKMYSWDTNASKGSFLRSVISDAICRVLDVNVHSIWKFIAHNSTDQHIGIPVLSELNESADFCFFDSWHTLDHLKEEVSCFQNIASKKYIIGLDDAYYTKKTDNFSYINMLRYKLGLKNIKEKNSNICKPFYKEIDKYLRENNKSVTKIDDIYKKKFRDDIFFKYYNSDRKFMNSLGMEEKNKLSHRFDAWEVTKF